jgi:hypothetical protein
MEPFTLQGVEGFHYRQGIGWQRIGGQGQGHRALANGISSLG